MIIEHAELNIAPERVDEFQGVLSDAARVVRQAAGFRWIEFHRSIETPSVFMIRIGWDTLSDHLDGFRGSRLFAQWRAVIAPYFDEPPRVEHYSPVLVESPSTNRERSRESE
jgi:quinol monooxygenase YgiN